jgi:hypothetical protein
VTPPAIPPAISTQPAAQSAYIAGQPATLSVQASGSAPLNYQWLVQSAGTASFVPVAGAISATFTTPALALSNSGDRYQVTVSNAAGAVTSGTVTLNVFPGVNVSLSLLYDDGSVPAGQFAVSLVTQAADGTLSSTPVCTIIPDAGGNGSCSFPFDSSQQYSVSLFVPGSPAFPPIGLPYSGPMVATLSPHLQNIGLKFTLIKSSGLLAPGGNSMVF